MRTQLQDETCDISRDGWCATHSDVNGPVYCIGEETLAHLRREDAGLFDLLGEEPA